jgi:hypothetical protein
MHLLCKYRLLFFSIIYSSSGIFHGGNCSPFSPIPFLTALRKASAFFHQVHGCFHPVSSYGTIFIFYDVEVKRWLREHRLVKLHKRLGHALALPSLAAVLRPLKISGQVPGTQHLLRSCPRPFGCLCNLTRLRAIGYLLTFTSFFIRYIHIFPCTIPIICTKMHIYTCFYFQPEEEAR